MSKIPRYQVVVKCWPPCERHDRSTFSTTALWIIAPPMVTMIEPRYVFGFFCFMIELRLICAKTMVPETKGRPLEQIEHELEMAQ